MKVAVVFASRHGGTREIAEAIAAELDATGLEAAILEADADLDVGTYEAVVLGSAIYAGRWLKSARHLLARRADQLVERSVWLFSSGPLGEPPLPDDPEPAAVTEAAAKLNVRGHVVFAGRLSIDGLKRRERLIVNALKAPEGDWRDWDAIRRWGREIAGELAG